MKRLSITLSLAGAALSCSPQVLPLDSILATIEAVHPELKAYDASIQAYDAYAEGARALDPPKLGGGLWMAPYDTRLWKANDMGGMPDPGMGSFMISAEQMFTNAGKRNANATLMSGMSRVDAQMRGAMRNDLFSMAKMSYYALAVLKRKQDVLARSEDLLDQMLKATEIRYTYDMDKLNAWYKAKAMLGDVQNMQVMNAQEMEQERITLNTLMVRDRSIVFDVDTTYVLKNYGAAPIDTAAVADNRSDYRAIDANIALLRARQGVQRSFLKPDFGVKYDHMLAFGEQPQQFSLMGMVTIPIAPWSKKMYSASITGLELESVALEERKQALLNQVTGELNVLRSRIRGKEQQLELFDTTILPSFRLNHQATLLAYQQGTEELFMVLDAWQNLRTAELGRLDLLLELIGLNVEYEKQLEIR